MLKVIWLFHLAVQKRLRENTPKTFPSAWALSAKWQANLNMMKLVNIHPHVCTLTASSFKRRAPHHGVCLHAAESSLWGCKSKKQERAGQVYSSSSSSSCAAPPTQLNLHTSCDIVLTVWKCLQSDHSSCRQPAQYRLNGHHGVLTFQ